MTWILEEHDDTRPETELYQSYRHNLVCWVRHWCLSCTKCNIYDVTAHLFELECSIFS